MTAWPETWNAIERFQMWLDNGHAAGHGESPEQQALFEGDLQSILTMARFSLIIEPMLRAHLEDLVMDTDEDEALRHKMLDTCAPWFDACEAVRGAS